MVCRKAWSLHFSPFTFAGSSRQGELPDDEAAKIVAMTCTHAALKRREFLQLGLKYDNLLMEESAQILEIETFIPMLLQVKDCTLWLTPPQTVKAVMIWFAALTMPVVFLVLLHGCKGMTCAGSVAPLCPVMCHA